MKGLCLLLWKGCMFHLAMSLPQYSKRAEEGRGYILRCYETAGKEAETVFSLPMLNRSWKSRLGRCEIKTFFIPDDLTEEVSEVNLLELNE